MKKPFMLGAQLLVAATTFAQTMTITMDAALADFKKLYNASQNDSLYSRLAPRIQSMLPHDKAVAMFVGLHGQYGEIKTLELSKTDAPVSYYKATFEKGVLTLAVSLAEDGKFDGLRLMPYSETDGTEEASNISLSTASGKLSGILTMPEGIARKVPVVLIIAGSGPTDHNGNSHLGIKCDIYRMVADSLRKHGIACLRYDKRGVGQSAGAGKDESVLRFDNYVDDAAGWLNMLKADSHFSEVVVMGHSEGSLIGMVAAHRAGAAGFVSVAGVAETADKILYKQFLASGFEVAEAVKPMLDSVKNGQIVEHVDPSYSAIFRKDVQPYLTSWMRYDPAQEIKKLKIPVLIVQGDHDIQVETLQAEMLKKEVPAAKLEIIGGMNHILKQAPADRAGNMATYNDITLPADPTFIAALVRFVKHG